MFDRQSKWLLSSLSKNSLRNFSEVCEPIPLLTLFSDAFLVSGGALDCLITALLPALR
ncbi:MAG: hypothetical protein ABFS56_11985 [Pseudomonadota bacterium]